MESKLKSFTEEELKSMNMVCFKLLENNPNINTGLFFFGCALKYILMGQTGLKGQGDTNEGIIARYRKDNQLGLSRIDKYVKYFGEKNLVVRENRGFYEVRRKSSLLRPIGCFYSRTDDLSNEVSKITKNKVHKIKREYKLDSKLFEDFKGSTEVYSDNFTMINYNNERMIYNYIVDALKKEYVEEKNVKIGRINYARKKDAEWECKEYIDMGFNVNFPYELFYKDEEFRHQHECRIVVNDDNWNPKVKYYYDEMLKVFYNSKENLNKIINIPENATYEVVNNVKISESLILRMSLDIRAT